MLPTVSFRTMRFVSALVVLVCAVMLVTPLSLPAVVSPDRAVVSAIIFYGVTAGAYGLLPFVRRGDIFMVAMWLVLGVGVAPCVEGEELSPLHMFADMAGVLMAAGPIYLARYRQVAQGDTRHNRRRETDRAGKAVQAPAALGVTSMPAAS
jgi:hypothetical protein